jgi:uncharacterized protein
MTSPFDQMSWLNPPASTSLAAGTLQVTTHDRTDFWRRTFYDFTRDTGHFLHQTVTGDFTAAVTVQGDYTTLYDQAGLMLRLSDTHWIKAGIEHTDGAPVFSTVVTNGWSDWATMALPFDAATIRLRLTRHAEAIRVQVAHPDGHWIMARLAYLPPDMPAQIGIIACSPERSGFTARFSDFTLGPAIPRTLHEDHP